MSKECKYPQDSRSYRFCIGCSDLKSCNLATIPQKEKKKCIVLETEYASMFDDMMNTYLSNGYKVASSSCNSKLYKAILIFDDVSDK